MGYGSHSLNKGESHYPAYKLKFFGTEVGLSQYFMNICLATTSVKSDNNPLKYILTMAWLDATGLHWVAQLTSYNFQVTYKSGND